MKLKEYQFTTSEMIIIRDALIEYRQFLRQQPRDERQQVTDAEPGSFRRTLDALADQFKSDVTCSR